MNNNEPAEGIDLSVSPASGKGQGQRFQRLLERCSRVLQQGSIYRFLLLKEGH